jgi:hypothetical protein
VLRRGADERQVSETRLFPPVQLDHVVDAAIGEPLNCSMKLSIAGIGVAFLGLSNGSMMPQEGLKP